MELMPPPPPPQPPPQPQQQQQQQQEHQQTPINMQEQSVTFPLEASQHLTTEIVVKSQEL